MCVCMCVMCVRGGSLREREEGEGNSLGESSVQNTKEEWEDWGIKRKRLMERKRNRGDENLCESES